MAKYRCTICGGTADVVKICCGKETLKIIEHKMPEKNKKERKT